MSWARRHLRVSTRGGIYSDGPMKSLDYQETYLKTILGFIGLTDAAVVRAEDLSKRPGWVQRRDVVRRGSAS